MDRRTLIQTLLGLSASSALPLELFAQDPVVAPRVVDENPKLALTAADAVSDARLVFLTAAEFAALRHLGTILMPASGNMPGAAEAEAAGFLDFLLAQSTRTRRPCIALEFTSWMRARWRAAASDSRN
jgi:hypothetical protein